MERSIIIIERCEIYNEDVAPATQFGCSTMSRCAR